MTTQTLLAWSNLAKLATISATSSEALMPPEATVNDIGDASTGWQSLAGVTTATLTYTLAVAGSSVLVIGLFRTNLSTTAQITATITYNSVETWTETLAGPAVGRGQVVFVLDAAEYADSVEIEIVDTSNPDGFLNVPLVFIGNGWLPTYSVAPSLTSAWMPQQNNQITRGGQEYTTQLSNARTLNFEFGAIASDEHYAGAEEASRLAGLGINFLVIPDANGNAVKYDAIFGKMQAGPSGAVAGASRMRTWRATVTERL